MDFIDFDSFTEDVNNPQPPQPALSLPIPSNIESLSKRFSNFNSLTKNLLNFETNEGNKSDADEIEYTKIAEKYAQQSLRFIDTRGTEDDSRNEKQEFSYNSLSSHLARTLNTSLSDTQIKKIFNSIEEKFPEAGDEVDKFIDSGIIGSITRKSLRGRIENELIKDQSAVLKEYSPAIKQLKHVEESLDALNSLNEDINYKINKNLASSGSFSKQVQSLNKEKTLLELKKKLLIEFKNRFTLNEYEEYVLNNGDINEEFFEVLSKGLKLSENCSILLSSEDSQLGLKIMTQINGVVSRAENRVTIYTKKTLGNFYTLHSRSRLKVLHLCLLYFHSKEDSFKEIIDSFVETRAKILVEEFTSQVNASSNDRTRARRSSSSSDNMSRTLMLSAHDSTRYIGDLFAYVHSIIVNESEMVFSVFPFDESETKENEKFKNIKTEITEKILSYIAKPMKSKIEQILVSEIKLSTVCSIYGLIDLYYIMFSKQLRKESELLNTVSALIKSAQDEIFTILNNRLATIESSNSAQLEISLDLQPPQWIIEFYSDILPILDQQTSGTVLGLSTEDNEKLINLVVDRPIDIFKDHIVKSKIVRKTDDILILNLNFLDLVMSKIMPINHLNDKVIEVNELITQSSMKLTEVQLKNLLAQCKLLDYYNVVNMICPLSDDFFDCSIYQPIIENKLFNKENIQKSNEAIQEFLPYALLEMQESLTKLNSPMSVNEVVSDSCTQFVNFFSKFNLLVEEYLKERFVWTESEIATLLGVEESVTQVANDNQEDE